MLTRRMLPALLLTPAALARTATSLQLVLAVDASGSVNMPRFILQKDGYAAAFRHPAVQSAIRNTATGSIAVMMLQWTGPAMQTIAVDWTLIDGDKAAEAFAAAIDAAPRELFGGGTSISGAIEFSAAQFPRCPFPAERRTIDVSGDGANNRGRRADDARDEAVAAGIVINGLPILGEPYLEEFYARDVIGGPGSFSQPAEGFEDFANAVRSKLIREIAGLPAPKDRSLAALPE